MRWYASLGQWVPADEFGKKYGAGLVVCAAGMPQNGERNPDGCAQVCFPWPDQPVVRATPVGAEGSPGFIGGRTPRPTVSPSTSSKPLTHCKPTARLLVPECAEQDPVAPRFPNPCFHPLTISLAKFGFFCLVRRASPRTCSVTCSTTAGHCRAQLIGFACFSRRFLNVFVCGRRTVSHGFASGGRLDNKCGNLINSQPLFSSLSIGARAARCTEKDGIELIPTAQPLDSAPWPNQAARGGASFQVGSNGGKEIWV